MDRALSFVVSGQQRLLLRILFSPIFLYDRLSCAYQVGLKVHQRKSVSSGHHLKRCICSSDIGWFDAAFKNEAF